MAPTATAPIVSAHSSSSVTKQATANRKKGDAEVTTSQRLMDMEHEYSAHNYHPLPVVFDRALGAK
ncbi:hypothetical protein FRC08_013442 [Ceratobasidium sp. 394]|nr:hypothetical protein FRC08_013442 [Ceratobasidium sp. 394]